MPFCTMVSSVLTWRPSKLASSLRLHRIGHLPCAHVSAVGNASVLRGSTAGQLAALLPRNIQLLERAIDFPFNHLLDHCRIGLDGNELSEAPRDGQESRSHDHVASLDPVDD